MKKEKVKKADIDAAKTRIYNRFVILLNIERYGLDGISYAINPQNNAYDVIMDCYGNPQA